MSTHNLHPPALGGSCLEQLAYGTRPETEEARLSARDLPTEVVSGSNEKENDK